MHPFLIEHDKTVHASGLLALLAAIGLLLWISADLVWKALPEPDQNGVLINPTTTGPTLSRSPTELASLHLFGDNGMTIALPSGFNAPETRLDLTLFGTFAVDEKPKEGYAIIGNSQGDEGHFRVGDEIPGEATLRDIYSDRVTLLRGGELETLRLRSQDNTNRQNAFRSRRAPIVTPPATGTPFAAIRNNNQALVPGINAIDMQSMQQLKIDPSLLASQVTATPYMQNGKQVGIRLNAGRNANLLQQYGIRGTDIITSVNGVSLDNPLAAMSLIPKLQSESSLTVTLLRDGQEITQNIELNP